MELLELLRELRRRLRHLQPPPHQQLQRHFQILLPAHQLLHMWTLRALRLHRQERSWLRRRPTRPLLNLGRLRPPIGLRLTLLRAFLRLATFAPLEPTPPLLRLGQQLLQRLLIGIDHLCLGGDLASSLRIRPTNLFRTSTRLPSKSVRNLAMLDRLQQPPTVKLTLKCRCRLRMCGTASLGP